MKQFWQRSGLTLKFMLPLGLAVAVLMAGGAWYLVWQQREASFREFRSQADVIEAQIRTTRAYITDNYVQRIKQAGASSVKVPLPATAIVEMARKLSEEGWYEARLISATPENERNRPRDRFEEEALKAIYAG